MLMLMLVLMLLLLMLMLMLLLLFVVVVVVVVVCVYNLVSGCSVEMSLQHEFNSVEQVGAEGSTGVLSGGEDTTLVDVENY